MPPRILEILGSISSDTIRVLPCERLNLDRIEGLVDYSELESINKPNQPFEVDVRTDWTGDLHSVPIPSPSLLRYFMDGSRRTYRIADIIVKDHYYPLIAGQVGVAVVEREPMSGRLHPLRQYCSSQTVLAIPPCFTESDSKQLQAEIERKSPYPVEVLRYKAETDKDPVDLGVARIMREMAANEVETVIRMFSDQALGNGRMLVVDGPLRFGQSFDVTQFRNVIGVSKTFLPSLKLGKGRGRQDVGAVTSQLGQAHRTCVYKSPHDDRVMGVWYVRLRSPSNLTGPLQGLIKVEIFACDQQEREYGFSPARIDTLSRCLYEHRNVTPFGSDWRWASHLYPVFAAESYVKSRFVSDVVFKAMF